MPEATLNKVLIVDTVFGPPHYLNLRDDFVLTEIVGQEGISVPFAYDITMARDPGLGDVDPIRLIGTMVRIAIKRTDSHQQQDPTPANYFFRTGMFQRFEKAGMYNPGGAGQTELLTYKGHIVPTFVMLARETRFRIFENLNAYWILSRILNEMQGRCPQEFRFNIDRLDPNDFPTMEYCVQFGESTYSFLVRLMERFGIWYTFDHDKKAVGLPRLMQAENETMVFGKYPMVPDTNCDYYMLSITDDDPDRNTIGNFKRQYEPKFNKMWAGNFNMFDPTKPPRATAHILNTQSSAATGQHEVNPYGFDLLRDQPSVAKFSESEEFPRSFEDVSAAQKDMDAHEHQEEAEVFSISGGTRNPTLLAGRKIQIYSKDGNDDDNVGDYLLKTVIFSGYEHSYLSSTATDVCNFLFRDFLFSPFQSKKEALDATVGIVNAGLNNYLQNSQSEMFNKIIYGKNEDHIQNDFSSMFPGGITQTLVTSAITALVGDIQKAVAANDGKYSNTFAAIPKTGGGVFRVPAPSPATRSIAHGPHLAVVIGPDGVNTRFFDVYADALGRVRIRFPWDPGPPKHSDDGSLPPPWTDNDSQNRDTFHTLYLGGDNTCWVRVSEGWAGRHYGSEFLPRVGQEVLVSFIDGDPERPIITGRVYNADRQQKTNLPFVENSLAQATLREVADLRKAPSGNWPFSGIKTWSIPTTDGSGNPLPTRFHLLRFSDKRDHEQYLIRSQHRLDITALEKRYESISSDRHMTVGGKKLTPPPKEIGGDYIAHVFRHYHLHVGDPEFPTDSGNRITLIEQNDQIQVVKNSEQAVGANWSTSVGGQATIDANGPASIIVLNATTNITLTVGGSSIVITPAAIAITSPVVLINSGGPPPAPPIDPGVPKPKDPTPADPGDTVTPPE